MTSGLKISEYKAVLQNAVLDFFEQEIESGSITPQRIQEISRYIAEYVLKKETVEDMILAVKQLKEKFSELVKPIETALAVYEERQRYKIA